MPALPGLPDVDVTLRRTARARRFSLRVGQADGRVTLTMPLRARESDALGFLRAQEDWLRRALSRVATGQIVTLGAVLPYQGQRLTLATGPGRSVRIDGDLLLVPGDAARVGARVRAWAMVQARDRLAEASDRYAAMLGRGYTSLALRDTRSRWGSCTIDGRLMYSWRLILAPAEVLDYVAAHEVAHLDQMNHSPAFWAVVDRLYPGWEAPRRWLKTHGSGLHAWQFTI
ncbi:M48 family metallopeptidase [Neogemmobacter tilapiae]|uniref:Zinc metalloprotease n=1 Tax=Neogemmobacter tilapiae TaxID=875041 RepID=A0A918TLM2_9RHOB|nr:SprT family zinc-dependent metalloprotease [Gemmobacter tilapiae]GHC53660.1 zinc metalloprotease [Gemmobacter tilapiae]